ncbi:uncharacterized protein LOC135949114 [Calliphora vicina]|uniref:uncharacterized protein LOC135949114 n=1 Tax=Calliphora vicina TaxID=7373 RepID=UPI00325B4D2A
MYVDNVLAGAHTLSLALKYRDELIAVLESAGFSLRKWTANNDHLLKGISSDHLLDGEFLKLSDSSTTKTLGLRWNAGSDYFYFRLKNHPDKNLITKRSVLSAIAKLFDPAGWLAPVIVTAKIIMQQIWKDGTNWDEDLQPATLLRWHNFLDDYVHIEHIKIPRFVDFDPSFSIELHGFCDASEKAYAATLYLRSENLGFVSTHLLISKTKVAPVKFVTLPRKELCGAELLAKMIKSVQSQLSLSNYKLYLWTDSTIVLAWLQKPPNKWKTFVENRVSSIIEKVGRESWYHVDSKSNPADLASRGITLSQLINNDLWWQGPSWLSRPHADWPAQSFNFVTEEETKPIHVHVSQLKNDDILRNFSDFPRAMRIICHVFRFYHRINIRLRHRLITTEDLKREELNFAIHLEATSDISTQAFLAAFARFFSRRGCPSSIYSDNGTAFVGAANILNDDKAHFMSLLRRKLIEQYSFGTLEWHFIPPGAPHMGGLWEAGVKSFKSHFKKISQCQSFTFEEFSTMLARIEACLNS